MATVPSLDDLLKSLNNAVLEAQQLTETQHVRQLNRYFKYKDEAGAPLPEEHEDYGMPYMQTFKVPELRRDVEQAWREIGVPVLSLSPPSSLGIKELKLRFEASLVGFQGEKQGADPVTRRLKTYMGPITAELGRKTVGTAATIDVTFEKAEAPEAYYRITDLLSKTIP